MWMKSDIKKRAMAFIAFTVLLFAVTPKMTIHELFGCHNSSSINTERTASDKTQFNKDGFHCNCDQQEFQPGFIVNSAVLLPAPYLSFLTGQEVQLAEQLFANCRSIVSLRGPPAVA
jgi:hypothetical protein